MNQDFPNDDFRSSLRQMVYVRSKKELRKGGTVFEKQLSCQYKMAYYKMGAIVKYKSRQ